MDKGPLKVFRNGSYDVTIYSDDFTYDAGLKVSGDFASVDKKAAYAQWIADILNAHVSGTDRVRSE